MTLSNLSDDEVLSSLSAVCAETRRLLGRLLLHLIEVESRDLHLKAACSSLYEFCQRRLGMSESEALRRIGAARLLGRFPSLLGYVERGQLHLTALNLLRDQLTDDNFDELVATASGKTKRQLQELLAARAPKPDVMPTMTALPALVPTPSLAPSPAPVTPARIEPLAPSRHRLELTVSGEVRAKLERARDLLSHRIRHNDLEAVVDRALDALLAKLEKERVGDGVPRAVRREVFSRDGEQCTFKDEQGNRCSARSDLELDHIVPRARAGTHDATNLRVVCRAHNRLYAEQAFGREHIERQIHLRQRRSNDPTLDVARRALANLGFRSADIQTALRHVLPPDVPPPPMAELLRTAIGLLTT
jgi:5-methylcytosine-specific restriction endonuclease McrA